MQHKVIQVIQTSNIKKKIKTIQITINIIITNNCE